MAYFVNTYTKPSWFESEEASSILTAEQLKVVQETCEIMQSEFGFEEQFRDLIYWSDSPIIRRIVFWISNLNTARTRGNTTYPKVLKAIIWGFEKSKPIVTQTQYQCEISLHYLQELLKQEVDIKTENYAKSLLINILILSERPDLCKRSLFVQMKSYRTSDFNNIFNKSKEDLLPYLYVNKEVPSFLFKHIIYLDNGEYQVLIDLLDCKGFRKSVAKYYEVSKLENRLIQEGNIKIYKSQNSILERYILASKVLKAYPNEYKVLNTILDYSKIFNDEFPSFKNDIQFWISVFRFFCRYKDHFEYLTDISHIIDYFEFKRYYEAEPFVYNLKGRTFRSVSNAVDLWLIPFDFSPEYLKSKWKPLGIEDWVYMAEDMSYIIYEITDGKRLRNESEVMKHCVYSYAHSCVTGSTHIFSLSKLRNDKKKPFVTIEVRNKEIVQMSGKANQIPKPEALSVIEHWAKDKGIGFSG